MQLNCSDQKGSPLHGHEVLDVGVKKHTGSWCTQSFLSPYHQTIKVGFIVKSAPCTGHSKIVIMILSNLGAVRKVEKLWANKPTIKLITISTVRILWMLWNKGENK